MIEANVLRRKFLYDLTSIIIFAVGSKYSWQNRERYFSPLGPPHLSSFTQTNISPLTKIYTYDLTERIFCICFKIISLLPPLLMPVFPSHCAQTCPKVPS